MDDDQNSGKIVGLQIGGVVGPNDRIGMHVLVPNVPGIGVRIQLGAELNDAVKEVVASIPSDHPKAIEIRQIVNEILSEKDKESKLQKIQKLVMVGAGITQIAVGIGKITRLLGF